MKKKAKSKTGATAKIISMMKRPSGATRKQLLAAIGWKAIGVQAIAKSAGVKLTMEKKGTAPIVYRVKEVQKKVRKSRAKVAGDLSAAVA